MDYDKMFKYLKRSLTRNLPEHQESQVNYGRLRDNLKYLFPSAKKYWKTGVLAAVVLAFSSLLTWPLPMVMRYLLDNVIIAKKTSMILPVAGIIVGLSIAVFLTDLARNFFSAKFTEETVLDLREKLLAKTFSLPKSFFDKNHSGYIISRISSDVTGIKFFISGTIVRLFMEIMRLIGGTVFLFYLEWRIALPVVATLPVSFVMTRFFARRSYVISHTTSELHAQLNASYVETVNNVNLVKSFATEEKAVSGIVGQARKLVHVFYESISLNAISNAVNKLMPSLAKLAVLIIGSYWVINGHWEIGTLIAYLAYLAYVYSPVTQLSSSIRQLQSARASLDRIASIMEMTPEDNSGCGKDLKNIEGKLEFENVTFYYERENVVIDNISFMVGPKEKWAIIGKSGIGKTTLISLIMRFYKPRSGKIYIDDTETSEFKLKTLRSKIAYVSQNAQFISGTILENLRYGCPETTREKVVNAAKAVRIHEYIASLPMGYDTVLEEGGVNLSEGQRQRLSLARSLVREAGLIILDEPTSALDGSTENSICDMLRKYFADRTVLLIAHRLDTVKLADKIILLRENKPPLIGDFTEFASKPEVKEMFGLI